VKPRMRIVKGVVSDVSLEPSSVTMGGRVYSGTPQQTREALKLKGCPAIAAVFDGEILSIRAAITMKRLAK
jgi:hypothetical protein